MAIPRLCHGRPPESHLMHTSIQMAFLLILAALSLIASVFFLIIHVFFFIFSFFIFSSFALKINDQFLRLFSAEKRRAREQNMREIEGEIQGGRERSGLKDGKG